MILQLSFIMLKFLLNHKILQIILLWRDSSLHMKKGSPELPEVAQVGNPERGVPGVELTHT